MKIGFDAKRIFFNSTGLGNHNRQFVEAFLDESQDVEVVLFSPKKVNKSQFFDFFDSKKGKNAISVVEPSGPFRLFGGSVWRVFFLKKEIENAGLDVFVGLSSELPFGIERIQNLRKIVVVHDLIFRRFPSFYPPLDRFFYERKTRFACRVADEIIAVSEQTRADLIEFLNISPSKITVISPAISPVFYQNEFENETENRNQKLDLKGQIDCPFLLSVGSIIERKNLFLTIRVFEKIAKKEVVDLVVIGATDSKNAPYLAKIKAFLAKKGLTERVHFFEKVKSEDLPAWFSAARVFIYPSFFEGFGMPIAESLFSKTPVVATDSKWAKEASGEGAILIDPRDENALGEAVLQLLCDPFLAENLAEKGWQHVQKFKTKAIAAQIRGFIFRQKK